MSEILIIGSGLAGLSAALRCAENGRKSVLISEQPSWCSQSVLAAGGINAALDNCHEDDSALQHEEDTWEAGCRLADREAVHNLAVHAPEVIKYLEECGVIFSRNEEGGIAQRSFGGQKKKRTCYSNANIGRQMVSGLEQRIRLYESKGLIRIMDHHIFLDVICENDEICGVTAVDRFTGEIIVLTGPVIAASGGMSGLFGNTTGSIHSDGSVSAALHMAGVRMSNLEMIQYHPTTIRTASKNMLVSEAARGEGGRLFTYKNGEKWYFCEDWFGERGNLMSRDIVSRAIYEVLNGKEADSTDNVWLDLTHIGSGVIDSRLGEVKSICEEYLGIDPAKEPIPVVPGIHYFMGGIWVDVNHRTSMKGLYAAGECCAQYHGANRLGGNSTLGAVYGGQCAADACSGDYADTKSMKTGDTEAGKNITARLKTYSAMRDSAPANRDRLQLIMRESMGIIRNQSGLSNGLAQLEKMTADIEEYRNTNHSNNPNNSNESNNSHNLHNSDVYTADEMDIFSYQTYNLCRLGSKMIQSAMDRKESVGAHFIDGKDVE